MKRTPTAPYICKRYNGGIFRTSVYDVDIGAAVDISSDAQKIDELPLNQFIRITTTGTKTETLVFHLRTPAGDKLGASDVTIAIPTGKTYFPGQTLYEIVKSANATFPYEDMPNPVGLYVTAPTGAAIQGKVFIELLQSRD